MSHFKTAAILFLSILLAAAFSACEPSSAAVRRGATPTPVPTLVSYEKSVFTVERGSIVSEKNFNAEIVPSKQDTLFFRTGGLISRVTVKSGDVVKPGDILAELQVDDLLNQLQQAKIDLEVAQTSFAKDQAQRRYAVEKAQIDVTIMRNRLEIARADMITALGLSLTKAEFNLQIAQQNLAAAELALKQAQEQAAPNEAQATERQKLAVQRLESLIAERRIVAPYDGVALRVFISAGKQATAFQPALEVGNPTNLVIRAQVEWKIKEQLDREMTAFMMFSSQAKEKYAIKYLPDFIPFSTSEATSATGFTQDFQYFSIASDAPQEKIKYGTSVVINAVLGKKDDVLILPPAAIRSYRGLNFVIVLDGDRRRRVEINKLGLTTSDKVEVEADLKPGERVLGQ